MQNWPLIPSNAVHQHNTRKADNIHMFRCHIHLHKKTLRFNIVHTVNDAPQNVFNKFNTHSLHGFSYYVMSTLLETYVDRCTIQNCYVHKIGHSHMLPQHMYINALIQYTFQLFCFVAMMIVIHYRSVYIAML